MLNNDQTLIRLLQDLVRIPSWVPDEEDEKWLQNENQLVDFIEGWLLENTNVEIVRQPLAYGRFNLIARKGRPDVIFLAHTDTVSLPTNAPYPPLAAEIHDGRIWGRGTADMKGGIASLMQAMALSPDAQNYWTIFYADEEYDFLGMKALVQELSDLRPGLIISADGSDLAIGNGCRGLIEIRARVKGVSGHAAVGNGLNAIDGVFQSVAGLRKFLSKKKHPVMGISSLNLAYVMGGKSKGQEGDDERGRLVSVGQEGNVIPDIAEFVIDVRPSLPTITSEKIIDVLWTLVDRSGMELTDVRVRHDLNAWYSDEKSIQEYLNLAEMVAGEQRRDDPRAGGYLDIQMLWEATGRPASFVFGCGSKATEHTDQENVKIEDLLKTRDFFVDVLNR